MRKIIFGSLLAAATALAIRATSAASATSGKLAPPRAEQANWLAETVTLIQTHYYRPETYLRTCGWQPTIYGSVRICT